MDLERDLVGHWPLASDTLDHSSFQHPTLSRDVTLDFPGPAGKAGRAACFNGQGASLEVADHPALQFGNQELAVAAWVHSDEKNTDVVGTLVSKFDTVARKGIELAIVTNAAVTSAAQPNRRHLHFGMDAGRLDSGWQDCGRPGNAVLVGALCAADGLLYAGTFEVGAKEKGHLWRYAGGEAWQDLGNPDDCNAIGSVVEFNGELYCATGRVDPAGHALGPAKNKTPGGKVYRIAADGTWHSCGHPGLEGAVPEDQPGLNPRLETGKADTFSALTVYRGELYGTSVHQRRGVFKYAGGERWEELGPQVRVMSMALYRGRLYVLENGPHVFRYEGGKEWTDCGGPADTRQVYAAVIHQGQLYAGTWPEGAVHRYAGGQEWQPVGHRGWVGYEREVMAMASYNGKAYMGSLPMANVYRMEERDFTLVGNLDPSPVSLRRVWSMAVYNGKLFAGTLPSGRVWSLEAGRMATWDCTFPGGWHHVAAVKDPRRLQLYVDGRPVACSAPYHPAHYDLSNHEPLRIGFGAFEYFKGGLSDLRIYGRALGAEEIASLAALPGRNP